MLNWSLILNHEKAAYWGGRKLASPKSAFQAQLFLIKNKFDGSKSKVKFKIRSCSKRIRGQNEFNG